MKQTSRLYLYGTALFTLACALWAAWSTRNWPLVGDAAILRYSVFLIGKGLAPYRQIIDVNLPGSYLYDWLCTRVFGRGDLAYRLFDGSLCAIAGAAMVSIATRLRQGERGGGRSSRPVHSLSSICGMGSR